MKLIHCCRSLMSVTQLPWVILSPAASAAEIARLAQLLPYIITACVTIEQCQELAIAVASLSGVLLLLDHASKICLPVTEDLSRRRPSAGVLPSYFTFTSGSSGSPQCVQCSGSSLWTRLVTQFSSNAPLRGLVPSRFRTADLESLDWTELLKFCAKASAENAAGCSVCIWKTSVEFCDTVAEMLQGVTFGVTQVIFCCDGALSVRCSATALALCGRRKPSSFPTGPPSSGRLQYKYAWQPTRFDVLRLFHALHIHQVSHMTAVPSVIASLLALEESCCPLLQSAVIAQTTDSDKSGVSLSCNSNGNCLFKSLRVIASSGEALHCSLVERLRTLLLRHAQTTVSLINVYGCTETTADASCIELKLPDESCRDDWGTIVPLGEALPGSCIGLIMNCASDICAERTEFPVHVTTSIRVSWLHDVVAPTGSGRVVVGGKCVAQGYPAGTGSFASRVLPELSSACVASPCSSFFAQTEAMPVFVTLDTAEIVAQDDGRRLLLYRGRQISTLNKIRGVFVSLERVEGVAQRAQICFLISAAGAEWQCSASVSVARAGFSNDSVIVAVAFDFVLQQSTSSAHSPKCLSQFSSRKKLHDFLAMSVQVVLRQGGLSPESIPPLHNLVTYSTNIFFADAPPAEVVASCGDVLPCRAPLLASGKLDYMSASRSLHDAAEDGSDEESLGSGKLALAIASCARQILGPRSQVSVNANLFDVGVDSLTGTRLLIAVQALNTHVHRHIPFHTLLQHPSAFALANALTRSPVGMLSSISQNLSASSNVHPPAPSAATALSSTQISDFLQMSAEDQVETRIIEWLPNASVRLWKMRSQNWECRIMCMTSATLPSLGSYRQHCSRLQRATWKIDMGACVDASPLICALRQPEFDHAFPGTDDELPIWSGFSMIAIIGSHTGLVVAARVSTGEILWSATLPDRVEPGASSAVLHPHSASVLVGCYDGFLYALCICKGLVKWKFDTNGASVILKAAPSQHVSSSKRPKTSGGEETLLNPEREPLKGGICLMGCCCCMTCSSWTKCSALIGVTGYSKRFFAILPNSDGKGSSLLAGSVAAPLLSCSCFCRGNKICVIAAATSGWLTCISVHGIQQIAMQWSIDLSGPLFSSPVCLISSTSPAVAVASATGHLFVVSVAHGHILQRLQPLQSPCSFMSAPRVVISSIESRVLLLLSSAGSGGILVLDCLVSGIFLIAQLAAECSDGAALFLSSPCIYRLEPFEKNNSFLVLACTSDGKLYTAALNCDVLRSSATISMQKVFDVHCGVFCSPAVVPSLSFDQDQGVSSDGALTSPQSCLSFIVVMGGRDNIMRCLR